MTTINLTPEQEEILRPWQGADRHRLTNELRLLADLADKLPPPPYVPVVGDWVHVFKAENGSQCTVERYPEKVVAVTDDYVFAFYRPECEIERPSACCYRIDAHRFEKAEK